MGQERKREYDTNVEGEREEEEGCCGLDRAGPEREKECGGLRGRERKKKGKNGPLYAGPRGEKRRSGFQPREGKRRERI